jgi:hypothetical protein
MIGRNVWYLLNKWVSADLLHRQRNNTAYLRGINVYPLKELSSEATIIILLGANSSNTLRGVLSLRAFLVISDL